MLREFKKVRQDRDTCKRLFFDDFFDLYVWYDLSGRVITGFQLVYSSGDKKKAFTWKQDGSFSHLEVDGWDNTAYEGSPLLVADGAFEYDSVTARLEAAMVALEPEIRELVLVKIRDYHSRHR